ncbi:MAG: ABC transporter permease subunit [Acetobacteraceae bacterium]
MRSVFVIAGRELAGYFATPVAVVFIVIFLVLQGVLTFNAGGFFSRGQADLVPFFEFLPWVFLLLVPAISMRLWAEERRLGTIEFLLTLPVTETEAVIGKFLAAWAFSIIALVLTFPFVITVNILGTPDNGVIAAGYLGGVLISGAFLAVGSATSAMTKNQVIAFVLGVAISFVFAVSGYSVVTDFLSQNVPVLAAIARGFSLIQRFRSISHGLLSLADVVFFASFICFWLFLNVIVVDHRKAS